MPKVRMRRISGFTLIELMIVVSIIALLAVIAIPKFSDLIRKSQEGAAKGSLGALRGAINLYYTANEGQFPLVPNMITPKYISAIPIVTISPYHIEANGLIFCVVPLCSRNGGDMGNTPWRYNGIMGDSNFGDIWVDCWHTDSRSTLWYSY